MIDHSGIPNDDPARRFFESCSVPFQAWLLSDDQTMPKDPVMAMAEHHVRTHFSPEGAALMLQDAETMAAFAHNIARQQRRAERKQGASERTPLPRLPTKSRKPYQKAPIPADLRWEVFERDNFTCLRCGSRRLLQADHIVAERKGGPTTLDNLQTLCKPCNVRKGQG